MVESMRLKKFDVDTINYVIDSFNYILKHRKFSYDSVQRSWDMQMRFRKIEPVEIEPIENELIEFDDWDYDDFEIDTNFFYDE